MQVQKHVSPSCHLDSEIINFIITKKMSVNVGVFDEMDNKLFCSVNLFLYQL